MCGQRDSTCMLATYNATTQRTTNLHQCLKSRTVSQTRTFVQAYVSLPPLQIPVAHPLCIIVAVLHQAESDAPHLPHLAIRSKSLFLVFLLRVVGGRVASNVVCFFADDGQALVTNTFFLVAIACLKLAICLRFSHLLKNLHELLALNNAGCGETYLKHLVPCTQCIHSSSLKSLFIQLNKVFPTHIFEIVSILV